MINLFIMLNLNHSQLNYFLYYPLIIYLIKEVYNSYQYFLIYGGLTICV
jgi:hypothetical protein